MGRGGLTGPAAGPEDALARALHGVLTPAAFSRAHFGWSPYPYQERVLDAILCQGATRIAWMAGRRVGKTDTIANAALQLAVRRPPMKIAIFAPAMRQASILARRIKYLLAGSRYAKCVVVDNVSELRLRFGTDAQGKPVESVIFANSLTGQVRGEGADVVILDESAFCDSEDFRNKVLPYIADRPRGIIIHISTPWSKDDHFWDAFEKYPEEPAGRAFKTLTRENPAVTPGMMAEFERVMRPGEFRREYECDLVEDGGVFGRDAVAACLKDFEVLDLGTLARLEPRRHHDYYLGVDWGKKEDCTVIAVVERGTQAAANPARLVFLHVYEPDRDNPHHYTRILDDVQRIAAQVKATRVVADEGEGGHQAEILRSALGGRFTSYRFTAKSRNWLVENARFLVERRAVELPLRSERVRQAFANVQRVEKGYHHTSRKSKDVFDAIALALHDCGGALAPARRKPRGILAAGAGAAPVGLWGYGHGPPEERRVVPDLLEGEAARAWRSVRAARRLRDEPA